MNKQNLATSSCRHCRHYQPEGRRGGMCHKLSVPVESSWKACLLASLPFTNSWESLEEIIHLEHSFALNCSSSCFSQELPNTKLSSDKELSQIEAVTNQANLTPDFANNLGIKEENSLNNSASTPSILGEVASTFMSSTTYKSKAHINNKKTITSENTLV
jgi:hypothetical protein